MKRSETTGILAMAGIMYGKPVSDALVDAWNEFMGDVTADEGMSAMRAHVTESPHFPTVADIRKRVALSRTGPCDPGAAWNELWQAATRLGRRKEPEWSSRPLAAAVEAVGYEAVCLADREQVPTIRAQFERYYRAAHEQGTTGANVGQLEAHRIGNIAGALLPARRGEQTTAQLMAHVKGGAK